MSETSRDYELGFARLLPELWTPECPDYGFGQPLCPDIRAPGNEAVAWRAFKAWCNLNRTVSEWSLFSAQLTLLANADCMEGYLYYAIEALGRTP